MPFSRGYHTFLTGLVIIILCIVHNKHVFNQKKSRTLFLSLFSIKTNKSNFRTTDMSWRGACSSGALRLLRGHLAAFHHRDATWCGHVRRRWRFLHEPAGLAFWGHVSGKTWSLNKGNRSENVFSQDFDSHNFVGVENTIYMSTYRQFPSIRKHRTARYLEDNLELCIIHSFVNVLVGTEVGHLCCGVLLVRSVLEFSSFQRAEVKILLCLQTNFYRVWMLTRPILPLYGCNVFNPSLSL